MMNNADIINALECCKDSTNFQKCAECPYSKDAIGVDCLDKILADAFDLINRQKAEIEELRKENFELKDGYFQKRYEETEHQELMGLREAWRKSTDQNMDLQIEIERLQSDLGIWKDIATRETSYVSIAKTEAIKEFAEKLNERKSFVMETEYDAYVVDLKDVDELVKEMTGGSDEQAEKKESAETRQMGVCKLL